MNNAQSNLIRRARGVVERTSSAVNRAMSADAPVAGKDRTGELVGTVEPAVAIAVEAQWRHVEDLIDMPTPVRRALSNRSRRSLLDRVQSIPNVKYGDSVPKGVQAIYNMPESQGRLVRIFDFVREGDAVVDIGTGQGPVGVRLLRSGKLSRFVGIELSEGNVAGFKASAKRNGIPDTDYEIQLGSAFDLAGPVIEDVQPTLVTMLEVLEHVPDPEGLVKSVAASLPGEADLLVSVPMLGEIEHDWGHLSVFDRDRVEAMIVGAGLNIHSVEVVMGQWLFVLASKSSSYRQRITSLSLERKGVAVASPERYSFKRIQVTDSGRVAGIGRLGEDCIVTNDGSTVVAEAATSGAAGFTVYLPGMDVLRLDLQCSVAPTDGRVAFSADGVVLEEWDLRPLELERLVDGKTLVFRRGFDNQRRHQNHRPGVEPERLEILLSVESGPIAVTLKNASYVPIVSGPNAPRGRNLAY